MKTNRDLKLSTHFQSIDVPAGATVIKVEGQGGGYALLDPAKYGLNAHDARHRYVWVPADAVTTNQKDQ
jgi:hypothetical protein